MRDILLDGVCYPPGSSRRSNAQLIVHNIDKFELLIDGEIVQTGYLSNLRFSDRMGSTNRKIFFANGNQFETKDNDTVDHILKTSGHRNNNTTVINKLESSWTFAIVSIVCTVLAVTAFFKFALPAAAKYGAQQVPISTAESLSEKGLQLMDQFATNPSELDENTINTITERFEQRLDAIEEKEGFTYTLNFRQMGMANAFALPGGDIVVTDALVALTTAAELDSILFHEIGHVEKRHSLTAIIRASTTSIIAAIALGDLSTVAELTTGVAAFYLQSNYSRQAEEEADDYALHQLAEQNMDPIHFANAMRKFELQINPEFDNKTDEQNDYLSTHPTGRSRINKAEEKSRMFNENKR